MTLDALLRQLDRVKRAGRGYTARCPAHEDTHNSLSVTEIDGKLLVNCHAGCETAAIVGAIGARLADLFTDDTRRREPPPRPAARPTPVRIAATYDYRDEGGTLLYQVVRYAPKDFRQRRPDGRGGWTWSLGDVPRVLYRLPEVAAAVTARARIYVVEGEKDADALAARGCVATTNAGGAGKWLPAYTERLRGAAEVVILPDHDEPGRAHAEAVAAALAPHVQTVTVVALPGLPPKGDVSDWLAAGGTVADLDRLVASARRWTPAGPRDMGTITAEVLKALEAGPAWVLPTGFAGLDHALGGGFRERRVGVVGAAPGVGKSNLLLQIAASAAASGVGVLVVSKEMADTELGERYLAQQGQVRALALLQGDLAPDEWRRAIQAQGKAHRSALWVDDRATTLEQITTLLARWPYPTPVKLLVVDYLQLFAQPGRPADKRAAVEAVSAGLKQLATARHLVVLVASSINRSAPLQHGKRVPGETSLRESGEIEHDADYVLLLWEGEREAGTGCPTVEWRLAKNRVGPKGQGRFRFRPQTVTLEDPTEATTPA